MARHEQTKRTWRRDAETSDADGQTRPGRGWRWAKRSVALLAGTGVAVTAAWVEGGQPDATGAVLAVVFGAVLGGSWLVMRRLDPVLGPVTASIAVMTVWGVAAFIAGVALPQCPGASSTGRCSVADAATLGLVGALTPGAMFAMLVPPVLLWRGGRGAATLRRRVRDRVTRRAPERARTSAPGHGTSKRVNGPVGRPRSKQR